MQKTLFCLSVFLLPFCAMAQLSAEFESGLAVNARNTIEFPNASASDADRFDPTESFGRASTGYYRVRISYTIAERHTVSLLYAPLQFNFKGNFDLNTRIGNTTFSPEENVDLNYTFNSYRLTYRFAWVNEGKFRFGIGLTAKVRDAQIEVTSEESSASSDDLGFVPLLHFRAAYNFNDQWGILARGDALVGDQGRAEDVFIGGTFSPAPNQTVKLGYRVLEGGADVDQVYNFSLIHYAAVAYRIELPL